MEMPGPGPSSRLSLATRQDVRAGTRTSRSSHQILSTRCTAARRVGGVMLRVTGHIGYSAAACHRRASRSTTRGSRQAHPRSTCHEHRRTRAHLAAGLPVSARLDPRVVSGRVGSPDPALRALPGALALLADHDHGGVRHLRPRGAGVPAHVRQAVRPCRATAGPACRDRGPDDLAGHLRLRQRRCHAAGRPCRTGAGSRRRHRRRRRRHARHQPLPRHARELDRPWCRNRYRRPSLGAAHRVPARADAPGLRRPARHPADPGRRGRTDAGDGHADDGSAAEPAARDQAAPRRARAGTGRRSGALRRAGRWPASSARSARHSCAPS